MYDSVILASLHLQAFNMLWGIPGKLTAIHTVRIITHLSVQSASLHVIILLQGKDVISLAAAKTMLLSEIISLYTKLCHHERSRNSHQATWPDRLAFRSIWKHVCIFRDGLCWWGETYMSLHSAGCNVNYYSNIGAPSQSLRAAGWPRTTPNTSQVWWCQTFSQNLLTQ